MNELHVTIKGDVSTGGLEYCTDILITIVQRPTLVYTGPYGFDPEINPDVGIFG
jgi:hypothetical protein